MQAFGYRRTASCCNEPMAEPGREKRRMSASTKLRRMAVAAFLLSAGALSSLVSLSTPALAASAPSAPDMTDATDSGSSFTDNVTNINKPSFTGTGTALSVVTVYAGSTSMGIAVVNPAGQWFLNSTVVLGDGPWVITAKQTTSGVVSAASGPLNIVIDTVIPYLSKPDLLATSDHGTSNSDNMTNTTTPVFQGTGSPGAFIALYNTTVSSVASIGAATVSQAGNWTDTVQVALPSGTHSYLIAARARDLAGNVSAMSSVLAIGVDTDIPATPPVPDLVAASDSGASSTDNNTNINLPTFAVKSEPFAKVYLYRQSNGSVGIGAVITDSNGNGSITASQSIPDGFYNVYAKAIDRSGNQAAAVSSNVLVRIDTTPPTVAGKASLAVASDSNVVGDNITSVTSPVVGGSFYDPYDGGNLTVTFFAGVFTYTVKTSVSTSAFSWTVTAPVLPSGVYDVTAQNIDVAGNTSLSPVLKLTIDNTPPIVAISSPTSGSSIFAVGSVNGTATDFHSGVSHVDLALSRNSDGEYWQGSVWAVGTSALTTTLSPGKWDRSTGWPTGTDLLPGDYTLTALAFDKAGNSKKVTSTFTELPPDTTPPAITIGTPTANQKIVISSFGAGTISGTATDNAGVTAVNVKLYRVRNAVKEYWDGTSFTTASAVVPATVTTVGNQSVTWSFDNQLPTVAQFDSGVYTVYAYAFDAANNAKTSTALNFTLGTDFTAPTVSITSPVTNQSVSIDAFAAGTINGIAGDNIGVTQVKVRLSRNRGGVISYWNGSAFTTAVATVPATVTTVGNQSVTWSLDSQLPTAADLDAGAYGVYAYAYDAAANSKTSTGVGFTITAPVGPIMGGSAGSS